MKDLLLVLYAALAMVSMMFVDVIASHLVVTVFVLFGLVVAGVMLNDSSTDEVEE